jgi:hypothetical protein
MKALSQSNRVIKESEVLENRIPMKLDLELFRIILSPKAESRKHRLEKSELTSRL